MRSWVWSPQPAEALLCGASVLFMSVWVLSFPPNDCLSLCDSLATCPVVYPTFHAMKAGISSSSSNLELDWQYGWRMIGNFKQALIIDSSRERWSPKTSFSTALSEIWHTVCVYSSSGFCCLSGWFGCRGCWWSYVHTALGLGWWSFNYGCARCSYIMALMCMEEGWVTACVFSTLVLSLH